MYYDFNQLSKDLTNIARVFGTRKQHGFFTMGVYEDDDLKIEDHYTSACVVLHKGQKVELDFLAMKDEVAMKILKLAIKVDERSMR